MHKYCVNSSNKINCIKGSSILYVLILHNCVCLGVWTVLPIAPHVLVSSHLYCLGNNRSQWKHSVGVVERKNYTRPGCQLFFLSSFGKFNPRACLWKNPLGNQAVDEIKKMGL